MNPKMKAMLQAMGMEVFEVPAMPESLTTDPTLVGPDGRLKATRHHPPDKVDQLALMRLCAERTTNTDVVTIARLVDDFVIRVARDPAIRADPTVVPAMLGDLLAGCFKVGYMSAIGDVIMGEVDPNRGRTRAEPPPPDTTPPARPSRKK